MLKVPKSRYVLFLALAGIGALVDLWTKAWAFGWLPPPTPTNLVDNTYWIWQDFVAIQTTVNQGALFGMGQGQSFWFAILSLVAAVGILCWLFIAGAAEDLLLTISLGSVMGGIIGNLYDRLGWWHGADVFSGHQYGVRDWILLTYQNHYHWPNFNIADSLLMLGAGLLLWHAYTQPEQSKQLESPESNTK